MGKLFKKSLAFCVAIAMVFTLFAGAISVNAETEETLTVTLKVKDTKVAEGATEVVLPLDVTCSGDTSINAIRFVITTTAGTVTNVASAAATEDYTLYYNGQYALLNAPDLTGFNAANLLVTVALNSDLTDEKYGITIDCRSDNAADANENALKISYETGYILLPFNHVHAYSDTYSSDENNHWKTCECGEKAEEAAHVFENDGEPVYADCVTPGTQAQKCVCGATTTVEVAAKGHEFVDGKCECGETESTPCQHTNVTFLSAESAELVNNGEKGKIHFQCDDCSEKITKDVTYKAVAGAATMEVFVESELLLTFEGKFTNFNKIDTANPESANNQFQMINIFTQTRNGEVIDNTEKAYITKSDATVTDIGYRFDYGLPVAEMCDTITSQNYVYIPATDTWYCGKAYSTSVKDYITSKLEKQAALAEASRDTELITLLVDTLSYGAAAQNYFDVNKENLANANLVVDGVDFSKYVTTATIDAEQVFTRNSFAAETPATISSPGIVFEQKIEVTGDVRFGSSYRDSYTDKSAVKMVISYTDLEGNVITTTFVHASVYDQVAETFEFSDTNKLDRLYDDDGGVAGRYDYTFLNFAAPDMKATLNINIYYGDTPVSSDCTWSLQSFVYDKRKASADELTLTLLNKMLAYGQSARAYFEKTLL